MRWEYKIARIDRLTEGSTLPDSAEGEAYEKAIDRLKPWPEVEAELNELGAEGWEVVYVEPYYHYFRSRRHSAGHGRGMVGGELYDADYDFYSMTPDPNDRPTIWLRVILKRPVG